MVICGKKVLRNGCAVTLVSRGVLSNVDSEIWSERVMIEPWSPMLLGHEI